MLSVLLMGLLIIGALDGALLSGNSLRTKREYFKPLRYPVHPTTTLFAFDLHEVLFKRIVSQTCLYVFKALSQGMWRYAINPFFWKKLINLRATIAVEEAILYELIREYPELIRFREYFFEIANAIQPITPTVELVRCLHNKGYTLYILSNIGQETYQRLCLRYPDIIRYFTGAYTPSLHNNYVHKPDREFYNKFKEHLRESNIMYKQIIFIDDLPSNLYAAELADIAGIHAASPRYIASVLEALQAL